MFRNNKLLLILIPLILIAVGAVFFIIAANTNKDNDKRTNTTVKLNEEISESSKTEIGSNDTLFYGNPEADVIIVEYIDYKCPNCNRFHRGVAKEIDSIYGSRVAYEIRAYPAFGPDSGRALRGSYCANDQNIFSQYHNAVLDYMWNEYYEARNYAVEIEDILTTDLLVNLISSTSADKQLFSQCIESTEKNALIDRDLLAAADDGIRGTPGFVVSGQSFVGLQPQSVFTALIGKELTN